MKLYTTLYDLYAGAAGPGFILIEDNAQSHRALIAR